jgi:hypothetical protein
MTKITLAAALLMGTATAALADDGFHPNRAKRHTAYAGATQSAPMRLNQSRNVSTPNSNLMMNVMDRASSPFACGG